MHVGYGGDVAAAQVLPGRGRRAQFHSRRGARRGGATDVVTPAQGARGRVGRAAGRPRSPRRAHCSPRRARPCCRSRGGCWPTPTGRGSPWPRSWGWRGDACGSAPRPRCAAVCSPTCCGCSTSSTRPIELELAESGSQPLVRSLVRGELDIALVIVPVSGVDPALHAVPLLRERLSVASAASARPPSARGSMGLRELARRSLVVPREGYDLREATLRAFADAGVDAAVRGAGRGDGRRAADGRDGHRCGGGARPGLRRASRAAPNGAHARALPDGRAGLAADLQPEPGRAGPSGRRCSRSWPSCQAVGRASPGDVQVLRRPDPV